MHSAQMQNNTAAAVNFCKINSWQYTVKRGGKKSFYSRSSTVGKNPLFLKEWAPNDKSIFCLMKDLNYGVQLTLFSFFLSSNFTHHAESPILSQK